MSKIILRLAVAILSIAAAVGACAQAPQSKSDLDVLVGEAVKTSNEIKKAELGKEALRPKIQDWANRLREHNSRVCTFQEGHSEQCAAYDREKEALEMERDSLRSAWDGYNEQIGSLRSHMGIQLAKIKLAPLLSGFEEWVERVRNCAKLPAEPAAACLTEAWEVHP
jgi:site-specific recombinase